MQSADMIRDFANGVTRIAPVGPVGAYQTYEISAPVETHWRKATCEEVDCPHYLNGWRTVVPRGTGAERLLKRSGRKWITSEPLPDNTIAYTFPPGQACFKAALHKVAVGREPLFVVRGGDWRGTDRDYGRTFKQPADFIDHFANHQADIAKIVERG